MAESRVKCLTDCLASQAGLKFHFWKLNWVANGWVVRRHAINAVCCVCWMLISFLLFIFLFLLYKWYLKVAVSSKTFIVIYCCRLDFKTAFTSPYYLQLRHTLIILLPINDTKCATDSPSTEFDNTANFSIEEKWKASAFSFKHGQGEGER